MNWHIVSDTSCDLFTLPDCPANADFSTVPFSIRVGDTEYIDDEHISMEEMLDANENHAALAQTSCPTPHDWVKRFSVLGPVLAFTISSALSGSYNSACTAREMVLEEQPDKKIAIIDTKATGPETVLIIRKACQLIRNGLSIEAIERELIAAAERTHIIFALCSYRNLMRAGRVNRLVGILAGHLHIWGIGVGDDAGKIAMRAKAQGQRRMIKAMIDEIQKIGLSGREIVVSHCQNLEAAHALKERLCEVYQQIKVDILPTRGLDSFYAERHGLIVAF